MSDEPPADSPRFYLGAPEPSWLRRAGVPLMVSHVRLSRATVTGARRALPVAAVPWILDSGGFSEIARHGRWTIGPAEYADAVHRYRVEVGQLVWCAPQDWMCEPVMLERTGLTVAEHQARTITSYVELVALGLPVVPVLQGWALDDYLSHVDQYVAAGVDLAALPTVGLGSVCRREATADIGALVRTLSPLRLHGFGVKASGLIRYGQWLTSADSMAWSYRGRQIRPCPRGRAMSCANCLHHALTWRARIVDTPRQLALDT